MSKQSRDSNQFYAAPTEEVLQHFETSPESGLTEEQLKKRSDKYGENRLRERKQKSPWKILFEQFLSMVIAVLLIAALIAFIFGQWTEGIAISAVIIVNTLIGFFTEWKAVRSMEALHKINVEKIRVRRDGAEEEIVSTSLVPGDIIIIESGDLVPADIRIIEANSLRVNESALTGESVPVLKSSDATGEDAVLGDRTSMLFKGTVVTDGTGLGVVTATGMNTELSHISDLAEQAETEATPLQKKLDDLGRRLAWITISIAVLIAVTGLLVGRDTMEMIETAIALGVAAIPEGLPVVATIALARGMYVMSKKNVLINKLQAVETLGSTGVIFTDKTGTLTENRMTVRSVNTADGKEFQYEEGEEGSPGSLSDSDNEPVVLKQLIKAAILCNNASVTDDDNDQVAEEEQGDPTETALLRAGLKYGMDRQELLSEFPEVREIAFESDTMMMATIHESGDQYYVAVKGAPEKVLKACTYQVEEGESSQKELTDDEAEDWLKRSEELAKKGLRLLAVADKVVSDSEEEPYRDLRFLGLAGLLDPARSDVKSSIEKCHSAGIRVIMVTGDQGPTASAIAFQTGISEEKNPRFIHSEDFKDPGELSEEERKKVLETDIFARVNPEQKLQLVKMMQENGYTVAMIGDGINDAPALKKADIGVAMGQRGTDAARQIADMVLLDDAFASIVTAVKYGRVILGNIRKSVMFMLCTNVAEVLAVTIATVIGGFYFFPLPLLPLQILYLNVVTDVFPALALGLGRGEEHIMEQKPRPKKEPVLTNDHWKAIGGWSLLISASVLASLTLAIYQFGFEKEQAVTISFLTLGFSKLWFTYNLRSPESTFFSNEIVRNPYVAGAIILCIFLLLATVYIPGLANVLNTQDPGKTGWYLLLGMSFIPFVWGQLLRSFSTKSTTE